MAAGERDRHRNVTLAVGGPRRSPDRPGRVENDDTGIPADRGRHQLLRRVDRRPRSRGEVDTNTVRNLRLALDVVENAHELTIDLSGTRIHRHRRSSCAGPMCETAEGAWLQSPGSGTSPCGRTDPADGVVRSRHLLGGTGTRSIGGGRQLERRPHRSPLPRRSLNGALVIPYSGGVTSAGWSSGRHAGIPLGCGSHLFFGRPEGPRRGRRSPSHRHRGCRRGCRSWRSRQRGR